MNPRTSVYLDAMRAGAAFVVFLSHASFGWFSQGQEWMPDFGHEMVIVFFVLSGFVIAFTHEKRPSTWRQFVADRLSRLYSVAVPALLLTALLDRTGQSLSPKLYEEVMPVGHYWERIGLGALFLNQSWGLCSRVGTNGPFWSLSYEFWYYLLFAAWVFVRPWAGRLVWIGLCLLLIGPKVVMLLPVWLLGVIAYSLSARSIFPVKAAPVVALITGILIGLVLSGVILLPGATQYWEPAAPFFFSGRAGVDFQLGLLVAANILAVDAWCRDRTAFNQDGRLVRAVRFCANRSFSLYLYHVPLLIFLRAIVSYDGSSTMQVLAMLTVALFIVSVLSHYTEQRREPWRRLMRRLFRVSAVRETRIPPTGSSSAS